ncbi:MAG: winged helix DNA-binding protein [Methylophilaceae bacterium]
MTKHASVYQTFLNLTHAIDDLTEFPKLSPDERCLIRHLNSYWVKKQEVKVVEVINNVAYSSPATVFRNLKKLRQKGYVELLMDSRDNRVKFVQPTELTISYFDNLGKLMLQSLQGH